MKHFGLIGDYLHYSTRNWTGIRFKHSRSFNCGDGLVKSSENESKRLLQVIHVRNIVPFKRGLEILNQEKTKKLNYFRSSNDTKLSGANNAPLDSLIFLEHFPVYTLGRNADVSNVLFHSDNEVANEIIRIERGGEVTFHGPGQIVGYPVLDLRRHQKDLHWYMRQVEQVIIQVLARFDIQGGRKEEYSGVWVDREKVCAIGLNASKWITSHGFALNVSTELEAFDKIIPCGISEDGMGVTSLNRLLASNVSLLESNMLNRVNVQQIIVQEFMRVFKYDHVNVSEINI